MVQRHKRKAKNSDYIIYFEKKLQIRKGPTRLSCKPLKRLFLLFNEIAIFISWLEHPVRIFGFRTFKIKDYTCITFNEDIFDYGNRKSSRIRTWVQTRLLMAEKMGFEPMLHSSHTTPLAGEPLEPLGYFSTPVQVDL